MLGLFSRTVKIPVQNDTVEFRTTRAFEFALAGRIGIPAGKISALVDLTDDDLLREAEGIRKLEQRFSEILAAAMQTGTEVGPVLKAMDLALVSQDNDWRTIIGALNQLSSKYESFKRIALVKYMQYLTARQEVIRTLYSQRQRNRQEAFTEVREGDSGGAMKETMIFDLSSDSSEDVRETGGFERLPKGETVELEIEPGTEVPLILVKHECKLRCDGDLLFVDDMGNALKIPNGRNTVGRDINCDLPMHPDYRDVSRKHLIIDRFSDRGVRLTDVSSLGTFISPDCLERTSI